MRSTDRVDSNEPRFFPVLRLAVRPLGVPKRRFFVGSRARPQVRPEGRTESESRETPEKRRIRRPKRRNAIRSRPPLAGAAGSSGAAYQVGEGDGLLGVELPRFGGQVWLLESACCVDLELNGRHVVEVRVESDEVVVVLDVVGDLLPSLGSGLKRLQGQELLLERREERLGQRIDAQQSALRLMLGRASRRLSAAR